MTLKQTLDAIKALGLTAKRTDGEYRVSVPLDTLKAIFGYDHKAALARNESLAQYDYDAADSLDGAKLLAGWVESERKRLADGEA